MWNLICYLCVHAGRVRSRGQSWATLWIEDIPKLDTSMVCVESREKTSHYIWYNKNNWLVLSCFFFSFVTAQCGLQFSSRGVRPGVTTVLARHLDKNTMGYLQWRWGIQSSMNTSIVRDTKSSHFTFAMQVSSQQLYQTSVLAKTPLKQLLFVNVAAKIII